MSVLLQAPAPTIETTTTLPNPEFSDVENQQAEVEVRRSMNNTVRTYIKRKGRKALTYTFSLTRGKSLELRAFIEAYYSSEIYLTNHKDEKWFGNLTSNPFEFTGAGTHRTAPGNEYVTITLNFEGVLI